MIEKSDEGGRLELSLADERRASALPAALKPRRDHALHA